MSQFNIIEAAIKQDFEQFDFADQPMTKYCNYNKEKHIAMSENIVRQMCGGWTTEIELEDLIHGLNHIFFNGVAAGQAFEWRKEK